MAGNVEPGIEDRGSRIEDRRSRTAEHTDRSSIFHPRSSIRRVLRLWKLYTIMDFTFVAADLRLAVVYFISDFISHFAGITAMLLLAERFAGIGAWSRDQVLFMLGYASTVGGLLSLFFGYNVLMISRRIGRGQLDHTLVQPQPVWMALLTEGFMPISNLIILIPGGTLLVLAASRLELAISAGWLALLAINILASCAIVLAFSFAWGSLAFWAPRAAEEVSSSATGILSELKTFPLDGLGPLLLGSLSTALPVSFVAWYPCRALLGLDTTTWSVWVTPLAALLLGALAVWIFQKGMHHYGRTGSQRYSDLGHRG
jgi:ABC-2 type transport system permease protein